MSLCMGEFMEEYMVNSRLSIWVSLRVSIWFRLQVSS